MKFHQIQTIHALALAGFSPCEISDLLKISRRLQRWHELECGTARGHIERRECGKVYFYNSRARFLQANDPRAWRRYPDYERAALRKLAGIMDGKTCRAYVQGDPSGCALYILRPGDVPAGESDASFYNRGIAVCA